MLTRDRAGSSRPPTVYGFHHVPHGHRNDPVHAEALLQKARRHVHCGVGEIPAVQISALDEGVGLSPDSGVEAGPRRDGIASEAESIAKASAGDQLETQVRLRQELRTGHVQAHRIGCGGRFRWWLSVRPVKNRRVRTTAPRRRPVSSGSSAFSWARRSVRPETEGRVHS